MPFRLPAYAKINLHLKIGAPRPDGYHALQTLFQEISLHDTLHFELARGAVQLRVTGGPGFKNLPSGRDNLVVKALELLRTNLGIKRGMRVRLEKRIPMGAGLGGGSSDAAAALWGGWVLWRKRLASAAVRHLQVPPLLERLARRLGADVPFFLKGGTAWAEGIGEKLTRLSGFHERSVIVIYPRVHVSTSKAYRWLDQGKGAGKGSSLTFNLVSATRLKVRLDPFPAIFPVNSFEPVILSRFPAVAAAHRALSDAGCEHVMLSGSGSAVYGFARTPAQAAAMARRLRRPSWEVFLARTRP